MVITASMVAELRTKTGCGLMECKKALTQAEGNMDEAIKILRENGNAVAAKKAGRIAAEGLVDIMVSDDKKSAVMIEVNAETDFVAKNEKFVEFVHGLEATILAKRPADVEALKTLQYLDTDMTVEAKLTEMIATIKENMTIRRFVVVDGVLTSYIHGKGATGVIVKFAADEAVVENPAFADTAKNVALQVAAMAPLYVNKEAVPAAAYEAEKEVQLNIMKNDPKNANKPENILEKMIVGKMNKFYEKVCLSEQAYVKDDSVSVAKYLANASKELGTDVVLEAFYCYEKGEGLEKREDNFGDEIASMLAK